MKPIEANKVLPACCDEVLLIQHRDCEPDLYWVGWWTGNEFIEGEECKTVNPTHWARLPKL